MVKRYIRRPPVRLEMYAPEAFPDDPDGVEVQVRPTDEQWQRTWKTWEHYGRACDLIDEAVRELSKAPDLELGLRKDVIKRTGALRNAATPKDGDDELVVRRRRR